MESEQEDHDQRLKVLLKEVIEQFLHCFFPAWAARFDFSEVIWLNKEFFLAPPKGKKRFIDLQAQLKVRPGVPPPSPDSDSMLVLVHIEVEADDSVQPLRPRMFEYYVEIRREYNLPVFPIGLYLRVGLKGVGWDSYQECFWDQELLRFNFAYVGLPALDAEEYVKSEHVIGAALSSLMRVPAERRAELHLEALKRVADSSQNDRRRYLMAECVEAYAKLDETDRDRVNALLETETFEKVKPLMITTYERGKIEGKLEGKIAGMLETLLAQLEARFGQLAPEVVQRVSAMDAAQLRLLTLNLLRVQSLNELHLQD